MASPWLRALSRGAPKRRSAKARSGYSRPGALTISRSTLRLERLEDRTVPATYYWVGAANSNDPTVTTAWSNPDNWDVNGNVGVGVPGATDVAAFSGTVPAFSPPGAPTLLSQPINETPVYDVAGGGQVFAVSINNSWTGNITVNNPLALADASEWDAGTITVAAGVTLTNNGNLTLNNTGGPIALAGGGTLANAGSIVDIGSGGLSIGGTLANTAGALFDLTGGAGLSGAGTFTNAGSLLKAADATPTTSVIAAGLQFSNSNVIDVEGGTLRIAAGGTYAGGTFAAQSGTTLDLSAGGTDLFAGAFAGSYSTANPGTVLFGSGTLRLTGNTSFKFPAGMFHWSGGTIDLHTHALTNFGSIALDNPAGTPDILTGNGTLFNQMFAVMMQTGAGGLLLTSGTTNATTLTDRGLYDISTDSGITGGTGGGTVNVSGTLIKSSGFGTSIISPGVVNNQGAIYGQSGTFLVNGVVQQSDNYLLGGAWAAGANATLTLNGGVPIQLIAASVSLSGAGSSFSNINGVLSANYSDFSLFGGASVTTQADFTNYFRMSVGAGCTFTADSVTNDSAGSIVGPGSIVNTGASGPATFLNSGQLRPASPPGRLVVSGNYSQDATGSLNMTINGPNAGADYDQLVVNGNVTLGGALSITAGYSALAGIKFTLIDNRGTAPINGTFANLPEGSRVWSGSNLYLISYKGGDGNDVVLTALDTTPVSVQTIQVNDGKVQRSEVRSITIDFTGPADFAGGVANADAAFKLRRIEDGGAVDTAAAVSTDAAGRTIVTLTFSGAETDPVSSLNGGAPSLVDGRYTLTILSADITGDYNDLNFRGGGPNNNYISPTDSYGGDGLRLYRLFGDANGDGVVDASDVGQLKSTFNRNSSDPLYISYLDANNDGSVDAQDVGQFKTRFNTNVVTAVTGLKFYVNPATGDDANDGLTPQTAWKTWDRLVAAVNDGEIPAGTWVNSAGAPADMDTINLDSAKKTAWYAAYLTGDRYVNGASIYIDTSEAPLQVTAPIFLPPGCEILSATNSLTDLRVNLPISPSEVWTRPSATQYPDVWGTTSTTDYTDTGLYETVRGQWAQLLPILGESSISAALPMLESNPGSFYVDPTTHVLYTHAIEGGNPNTDGVAREYVPAWAASQQGRIITVTNGRAYLIGGDGGFGVDPVTSQATGATGIGISEWDSISVIDSCEWTNAGKHTFSATGNYGDGLAVFRDDVAEAGPGGVFTGYWSHFVDYTSYAGAGAIVTIYDGDTTVNGIANLWAPGGSDAQSYSALIEHTNGANIAFGLRVLTDCTFNGGVGMGENTAVARATDCAFNGGVSSDAATTTISGGFIGNTLPALGQMNPITATLTGVTIAPGSQFIGSPIDDTGMSGNITFSNCVIDLSGGNIYSTAWGRAGPIALTLDHSTVTMFDNTAYGLVSGWNAADSLSATGSTFTGTKLWALFTNYNGASAIEPWQWARDQGYIDGTNTLNGSPWAQTSYVSQATFAAPDGTPLANYTPNIGPAFTNRAGTWEISGDEAYVATSDPGGQNIAWLDAGRADGAVSAVLHAGNASSFGVVVNGADANNYWLASVDLGQNAVYLVEVTDGNSILRTFKGALGITAGSTNTLTVDPEGDTISVYWDGTQVLTYTATDRPHETNSFVGMESFSTTDGRFDQFDVVA